MKLITSEYYERIFEVSDTDLEAIYRKYESFCETSMSNPEISLEEFISYPDTHFDHVLYHAEITDGTIIDKIFPQ